ncbi:putative LysR family transcriptional regulator [Paenibacillus sp. NAIST15-1]|nr:putative LysR family transcriptional regulator [Paenibacillus sp. NAIST15-1]
MNSCTLMHLQGNPIHIGNVGCKDLGKNKHDINQLNEYAKSGCNMAHGNIELRNTGHVHSQRKMSGKQH